MGRIVEVRTEWVEIPLREIFVTSKGKRKRLESLIYTVFTSDGVKAIGESPTSTVYPHETKKEMTKIANSLKDLVLGRDVLDYEGIIRVLRETLPYNPMSISGLEQAIFRAYLSSIDACEFSFWGARKRRIETDITVPNILSRRRLERWIGFFGEMGFTTFKLKLSGNLDRDKLYLNYIRDALEKFSIRYSLRLDMNEGYNLNDLFSLLSWLLKGKFRIDFLEQPLPKDDLAGLRELARESHFLIVLDESVTKTQDLERIFDLGIRFGVNLKIAKSGILETKKIHDLAVKLGVKLMMGCMIESFVGLSSSILFAMGHGDFDYIDLDSIHFLDEKRTFLGIEVQGPSYTFTSLDFSHDPM